MSKDKLIADQIKNADNYEPLTEEMLNRQVERTELGDAIEVLIKALKKDKSKGSYYYSWQSNIAMAMYDEIVDNPAKYMDENNWDEICNAGAKRFLNLLLSE